MKFLFAATVLLTGAAAYPSVLDLEKRASAKTGCSVSQQCNQRMDIPDSSIPYSAKSPTPAQRASAARNQGGALNPITFFDATEQYVSTTGQHAYHSPAASDIRGPCPGLNAAANHGYLPRNGLASIQQTITGLGSAYGMATDLAGFLAAYAVFFDGSPAELEWSIGGPLPDNGTPLAPNGQGISYSHNKYEGDSSIGRCDAYINGGDAHSLSIQRFKYAFESGMDNDRYTLDKFARAFTKNAMRSEAQNPYYFAPLFSTTLVSPAAYNFVIVMMSNHTKENPAGYLNGHIFKTFFGVTGKYPNFVWKPGQERIPDNWYRRPRSQPYGAGSGVFGDLISEFVAYPRSFRFGGNTNGVNTYTGIDLTNFTNGAYNANTLFQGNNLRCFFYQTIQQALPDVVTTSAAFNQYVTNFLNGLGCPQVSKFNDNNFGAYPGHTYSPTGPATNC